MDKLSISIYLPMNIIERSKVAIFVSRLIPVTNNISKLFGDFFSTDKIGGRREHSLKPTYDSTGQLLQPSVSIPHDSLLTASSFIIMLQV